MNNAQKMRILFATLEHLYCALNIGWWAIDEHPLGKSLGMAIPTANHIYAKNIRELWWGFSRSLFQSGNL